MNHLDGFVSVCIAVALLGFFSIAPLKRFWGPHFKHHKNSIVKTQAAKKITLQNTPFTTAKDTNDFPKGRNLVLMWQFLGCF